jgi:HEAT repeat protein
MSLTSWLKYGKLQSSDPKKRAAAVAKLIESPDPAAIEPLVALLRDEQRAIRVIAAQALGAIGKPRAVGGLVAALLEEKQWEVRHAIVEALRQIGDPTAVNELILVVERGDADAGLQQVATWALKEFGWDQLTAEQQAMVLILRDDWAQVCKLGAAAINPLLAAIRTGTSRVRLDAAEALAKMTEPRATAALFELCVHGEVEVRTMAAQMLERHASSRLSESDAALVAVQLGKWSIAIGFGKAAIEPLEAAARQGPLDCRRRALEALHAIGGDRVMRFVREALADSDAAIRALAAELLGERVTSKPTPAIQAAPRRELSPAPAQAPVAREKPPVETVQAAPPPRPAPSPAPPRAVAPPATADEAIARDDWSAVACMGRTAMGALLALVPDAAKALKALAALELIVQQNAAEMVADELQKLAALANAPPPPGGRAAFALGGKTLQVTVARRRLAQLARSELQRRKSSAGN